MEIVQERLDREFDMNVITTVPNVSYHIYDKQGNMKEVHNPGGMPDPTMIDHIEEPYIDATVITATDYIGPIMTLCLGKRGDWCVRIMYRETVWKYITECRWERL